MVPLAAERTLDCSPSFELYKLYRLDYSYILFVILLKPSISINDVRLDVAVFTRPRRDRDKMSRRLACKRCFIQSCIFKV